jgi:hypothetical protein
MQLGPFEKRLEKWVVPITIAILAIVVLLALFVFATNDW